MTGSGRVVFHVGFQCFCLDVPAIVHLFFGVFCPPGLPMAFSVFLVYVRSDLSLGFVHSDHITVVGGAFGCFCWLSDVRLTGRSCRRHLTTSQLLYFGPSSQSEQSVNNREG